MMAVSPDIFEKAQDQIKDFTGPAPTTRAEAGWSLGSSLLESGKELGSAAAAGFAKGSDFIKAIGAGIVMPFIPEGDTPAARAAWSILKPSMDTFSEQTKQRAEQPKTVVGKVLNPMVGGIGGMATMPILPGAGGAITRMGMEYPLFGSPQLAAQVSSLPSVLSRADVSNAVLRNVISGAGMGEGSEIGKNVLGGLAGNFSPEARSTGEAVGSILGGGAGAQLNVTRAKMLGEAAKGPIEAVKSIGPAYEAARAKQAAGDPRRIWEIFADEFGNLRAETRGIVADYTNRELASAVSRDIQAMSNAEQFDKDVKQAGVAMRVPAKGPGGEDIMVQPWGLGERTMVPAITRMAKERVPKTFAEGVEMDVQAKARQRAIADAYNKVAGPKPLATEEGAQAAGDLFQKVTQAKVDALGTEQSQIRQSFPDIASRQEYDLGESLRTQRDALNKQSLGVAAQKYNQAEQMFDQEGARIGVQDLRAKTKEFVNDFIAQVDPRAEIPPVLGNLLAATKGKPAGEVPDLSRQYTLTPSATVPAAAPEPKTLSLNEANDLVRSLNRMANDAIQAEKYQVARKALSLKDEVLQGIEQAPASPEAKLAYDNARRYWANEHAPRFMEGFGKALGRERGGVYEGREAVEGQKVLDKVMSDETGMREFDRIYGNNPEARAVVRTAIEGRFRDAALNGQRSPEQFEIMVQKFKNDYDSVLSRFPDVAKKIDAQSAQTLKLMREQESELQRYKDVMGGPITQAIGPVQAKALYGNVLADPLKMDALLNSVPGARGQTIAQRMVKEVFLQANPMKNGEYDGAALMELLSAGKSDPARQASIEKLFTAAYGKAQGKEQLKTLESLAELTMREAVTNPSNLRPGGFLSESPVKEKTGQTMASWISAWRQQEAGLVGSSYFTILGLSRFANAKVQAAVEAAKLKALYDPATAEAILQMAKTPASTPLGVGVVRKIFGNLTVDDGKKLVDKLMDGGYLNQHIARGVLYGTENANTDQKR